MDTYPQIDLKNAKILVVDDALENLNVLRQILESEGYSVLLAPSGEIALRIAREQRPDLILLDVVMPKIDGFEVCRQLKSDSQTASIPTLFVTATTDENDLTEGFAVGAVGYITKPFHVQDVLIHVRTHLTLTRLAQILSQNCQ